MEQMESKSLARILARIDKIGDETTAERSSTMDKLKVGAGALASTLITGLIDQVPIVGQQGGINHIVVDSFLGALTGTLLVGNFYYRLAQRLHVPERVPFIGGKTIASSPNTYQITNAALWASIGTAAQTIVMHYI
jgi:hypothetical protein